MTLRHKNLQMDQRIVAVYRILNETFLYTFKHIIFANLGEKIFDSVQIFNFKIFASYPLIEII
jgi:hypothetical protein